MKCLLPAQIVRLEYGENFSKLCAKKFEEYNKFSVITEKFENVSLPESQYDLVYSASAFQIHFMPNICKTIFFRNLSSLDSLFFTIFRFRFYIFAIVGIIIPGI